MEFYPLCPSVSSENFRRFEAVLPFVEVCKKNHALSKKHSCPGVQPLAHLKLKKNCSSLTAGKREQALFHFTTCPGIQRQRMRIYDQEADKTWKKWRWWFATAAVAGTVV